MSNATIAVSRWEIIESDCVEALRGMAADSVDACLTDVPYGLGSRDPTVGEIVGYLTAGGAMAHGDFMNKKWEIPPVAFWRELCRVLKPGAHVLCFAGTRTMDLIMLGIRAGGFELRDSIGCAMPSEGPSLLAWQYASGFPKSLNVHDAIVNYLDHDHGICSCTERKADGAPQGDEGREESARSDDGSFCSDAGDAALHGVDAGTAPASGDHVGPCPGGSVRVRGNRRLSEEAAGRYPVLQVEAGGEPDPVFLLRQIDAPAHERQAPLKADLLLSDLRGCSAEDTGLGGSPIRPGLEEGASGDTRTGPVLPRVREPSADQHVPPCAPPETVPVRGHKQPRQSRGRLQGLSPSVREDHEPRSGVDPDRREPRRVGVDRDGTGVLCAVGVCSWCGRLPRESLDPFDGVGTSLAPAWEPIILARKPLDGTVSHNATTHGTGGLAIDASRVEGRWPKNVLLVHDPRCVRVGTKRVPTSDPRRSDGSTASVRLGFGLRDMAVGHPGYAGPDGLEDVGAYDCVPSCPCAILDAQSGDDHPSTLAGRADPRTSHAHPYPESDSAHALYAQGFKTEGTRVYADDGAASRFYSQFQYTQADRFRFVAKASRSEREFGCEGLPARTAKDAVGRDPDSVGAKNARAGAGRGAGTTQEACSKCGESMTGGGGRQAAARDAPCTDGGAHDPVVTGTQAGIRNIGPCVKPIALTRYLAGLLKPPAHADGSPLRILCPYAGTGSEMIGALRAGWDEAIGIQRISDDDEKAYVAIARARLARWDQVPASMDEADAVRESRTVAKETDVRQRSLFDTLEDEAAQASSLSLRGGAT